MGVLFQGEALIKISANSFLCGGAYSRIGRLAPNQNNTFEVWHCFPVCFLGSFSNILNPKQVTSSILGECLVLVLFSLTEYMYYCQDPLQIFFQYTSHPWLNIDYYMLRAWYRFYSRVFNTISRTSESTSWEVFLAVFLFSFSSRNGERSSSETFTNLEVISLIKLQSNSSRQNWRQAPGVS